MKLWNKGKVEPPKQLLAEEKLAFQISISKANYILSELIITYISAGKCTFNIKDTKNVPVKGIDDKRQRQLHLQNL